jgi:hypothetical protein
MDGIWRSRWIRVFGTYRGASTAMRRAFYWKRSRKPCPRVGYQVQIGLRMILYRSSLLLKESCVFRPSSQYVLVRLTPRCFHLVKSLYVAQGLLHDVAKCCQVACNILLISRVEFLRIVTLHFQLLRTMSLWVCLSVEMICIICEQGN